MLGRCCDADPALDQRPNDVLVELLWWATERRPVSTNTLVLLKHTTTLFSLSDHYIVSREWRVTVDLEQSNYHGKPMVLKSVRCDRAVDYEGSSLCSDVF